MAFQKQEEFSKKIADLPDRPIQYTSNEIKQYFDSSPEELKETINKLIDAPTSTVNGDSGAKQIGVTPIDNSPSDIQGVLKWLKDQIDDSIVGTIPDASIMPVKLASSSKQASIINVTDTSNYFTATTVEGVLAELFQFADSGKKDIASVIGTPASNGDTFSTLKTHLQNVKNKLAANLSNKGQASSGSESLDALAGKVSSLNIGKRFKGPTTLPSVTTNGTVTVSGLGFRPSVILINEGMSSQFSNMFTTLMDGNIKHFSGSGDSRVNSISSDGFTISNTSSQYSLTPTYWAYE